MPTCVILKYLDISTMSYFNFFLISNIIHMNRLGTDFVFQFQRMTSHISALC